MDAPATNTTLFYSLDGGVRCGVPCRCADGELTGAMVARLIADDLASSVHAFTFLVSPQGGSGGGDRVPVGEMDILSPASEIIVRERHRLERRDRHRRKLLDAPRCPLGGGGAHDPETCGGSGGVAETADGEDGDALMGRILSTTGRRSASCRQTAAPRPILNWDHRMGPPVGLSVVARPLRGRGSAMTGQLRPVRFLGGTASLARVPQHMIVAFSTPRPL